MSQRKLILYKLWSSLRKSWKTRHEINYKLFDVAKNKHIFYRKNLKN